MNSSTAVQQQLGLKAYILESDWHALVDLFKKHDNRDALPRQGLDKKNL